jgi:hypothetical protein
MKRIFLFLIGYLFFSSLITASALADVQPLIGATLFGGAERGPAGKELNTNCTPAGVNCDKHRETADVVGLGGFELFGVLPFSRQFGLQGGYGFTGQEDGYRLGVSLGPVYGYSSGKVGLFVDYEYRKEPLGEIRSDIVSRRFVSNRYQNFVFLRALWAQYFPNFDLVLSYTQPIHEIQESSASDWDPRRTPACFPKKAYTINEFKGTVRFYPTAKLEVDTGMLVNSFAGPDRNVTGTGVGGLFGLHYGITENIVFNIVQAQGDSRSRFRATSGIQFFWSPESAQKQKREERRMTQETMLLSASGGGTHGNCL